MQGRGDVVTITLMAASTTHRGVDHERGFHGPGRGVSDQQRSSHQTQQRYQPVYNGGRDAAESNQQGAALGLQQQGDQGTVKKKRPICFRCKCGGHSNEDCKADLDCIICNKKNSLISSKCPILKMPKPNATFFGSGKKEFGFLRISDIDYKLEAPDLARTALVKVTGGKLTPLIVQTELGRLAVGGSTTR